MWKASGVTWKSAQFLIFTIVVVFFFIFTAGGSIHARRGWSSVLTRVNLNVASACPPEPSYLPSKSPETTKQQIMFFLEALWHKVLICCSSVEVAC